MKGGVENGDQLPRDICKNERGGDHDVQDPKRKNCVRGNPAKSAGGETRFNRDYRAAMPPVEMHTKRSYENRTLTG